MCMICRKRKKRVVNVNCGLKTVKRDRREIRFWEETETREACRIKNGYREEELKKHAKNLTPKSNNEHFVERDMWEVCVKTCLMVQSRPYSVYLTGLIWSSSDTLFLSLFIPFFLSFTSPCLSPPHCFLWTGVFVIFINGLRLSSGPCV